MVCSADEYFLSTKYTRNTEGLRLSFLMSLSLSAVVILPVLKL